jgi:transcriptional regulator with XRE-family HTH domain
MQRRMGPFKNKVKEIREKLIPRLSQKELAERLRKRGFDASGAYISQIEAGLKDVPYRLAVAICEELGHDKKAVTEIFLTIDITGSLVDQAATPERESA